ncbi:hypothetical protein AURDEDRAFT_131124 [Auricularia subglabra TFB-10046 SS5]|uniref:Uncharacterized protein n=1 Tax=Auricularia subglabra (strain TFB-10046 / SS5) TaxID=717982 RepID=J0LD90_AURST|nr:hypothetical protein AURDEDRAFT_131124 [Auricularia subglabra TFB-10046 SS5]
MSAFEISSLVVALYEPERIPGDVVGSKGYNVYHATLPLQCVVSSSIKPSAGGFDSFSFDVAINRPDVWPGVPLTISCWVHRDQKRFALLEELAVDTPILLTGVGCGWSGDNKLIVDVYTIAYNNEGPQPSYRATDAPNPFYRALFKDGFPTFPYWRYPTTGARDLLSVDALPTLSPPVLSVASTTGAVDPRVARGSINVSDATSSAGAARETVEAEHSATISSTSGTTTRRNVAAKKLRSRVARLRKSSRVNPRSGGVITARPPSPDVPLREQLKLKISAQQLARCRDTVLQPLSAALKLWLEYVYIGQQDCEGEMQNVYMVNSYIPLILQNVQMPISLTYRVPGLPHLDGTYATVSGPAAIDGFHIGVSAATMDTRASTARDVRPPQVTTTRLRFEGTIVRSNISGQSAWRAGVLEFDVTVDIKQEDGVSTKVEIRVFKKLPADLSTLMVVDIAGDVTGWVDGMVRVDVVNFDCICRPAADAGAQKIDISLRRYALSPDKRAGPDGKSRRPRGRSPAKEVASPSPPLRSSSPFKVPMPVFGSPTRGFATPPASPTRSPTISPFLGGEYPSPPPRSPSPMKDLPPPVVSLHHDFIKSVFAPSSLQVNTTDLLSSVAEPEPMKANTMEIPPSYEAAMSPERTDVVVSGDNSAINMDIFPHVHGVAADALRREPNSSDLSWDALITGWDSSVELPAPDISLAQPVDVDSLSLQWAGSGVDPQALLQQLNGILDSEFEAANLAPLEEFSESQ